MFRSTVNKIALASDLKEITNTEPFEFIKELMNNFNAHLDIINVVEYADMKAEAVPVSVSLQNQLSKYYPQFHFIDEENVEDGVYDFADKNKPDLLIVIPKKRGFLEAIFHKSKSKQFILHPRIPVLALAE